MAKIIIKYEFGAQERDCLQSDYQESGMSVEAGGGLPFPRQIVLRKRK